MSADGDLSPLSWSGVPAEALLGVHDQDAVRGQSVHLAVPHPPLGRLLLHSERGSEKGPTQV